jgi:putative acetyltransferase
MPTPPISIDLAPAATDDVHALIGELDRALSEGYLPEQRHGLSLADLFEPHIRFFLARMGSDAVGCGGVALFADFAELKRMYVREAWRGSGAASALLARLEREARIAQLAVLRLETGVRQIAAIRFYERSGFRPCVAFGAYAAMKASAVATSVFFEKRL